MSNALRLRIREGSVERPNGCWEWSGCIQANGYGRLRENGTELKVIRNGLRLSVAELARMLGVSRPTIYNWQRGGQLDKDNEIRVREIAGALAPHLELLATQTGRPAYRAIQGSTTLLDALARGDAAKSRCDQLIDVLQSEKTQRNRLAQRLSNQTSPRGRTDVDSVG